MNWRPASCLARQPGAPKKNRRQGQALDHENRKTPISKPAANAQRPNVQAEITRTRIRRSCGISWDRSVIAAAPLRWPPARYGRIGNPCERHHPPPDRCRKEGNSAAMGAASPVPPSGDSRNHPSQKPEVSLGVAPHRAHPRGTDRGKNANRRNNQAISKPFPGWSETQSGAGLLPLPAFRGVRGSLRELNSW